MADDQALRLGEECRVLACHVAEVVPGPDVIERYRAAHARGVVEPPMGATSFDRTLVGIARLGRPGAWFADSYASLWRRSGLLRRKLVLLLALLETSPSTHRQVLGGEATSRTAAFLRLLGILAASGFGAVAATILLTPVRLLLALVPSPGPAR